MLVSPDNCGVDHDPLHIRIGSESVKDHLPDPRFGPAHEPFVSARPFAIFRRQSPPGRTVASNPHDG